ncbi:MAG: PorT family protein [Bacteroidales bacterium]|jgi:hypothetical protein|nr:PorT family protein [Bacteroidales bacterium]
MKKVLITLSFVCVAAVCSALPNFGAKIGGNFSKFTVSKSEANYSFQPGFDIGFFARIKHHKMYVQPELVYSYQTTKYTYDDLTGKTDVKNHTHNLNIPVLVGYKLVDVKLTNVRVFLGPEFNYVLSESTDLDLRTPANIAGCIGAGIDIAMLTLDLRYGYTFNKAIKDDEAKINPHNNVVAISLGWKFL